ncbi:MAG: hypothetical protein JWP91_263 [Fibrobacteres bacterium]|nr:hypothetical protein [Fibrobacterota bacterium]
MKTVPLFAAALLAAAFQACRMEPPDPASQAAAILHKHPSDFLDQLASLDALAIREAATLSARGVDSRPLLAESLYAYTLRLAPALAAIARAESASASGGTGTDTARPDSRMDFDSARVAILNAFVFDSLGIRPLLDPSGLESSIPSLILARREGSCVGLVLLYLALGRSLDLPLVPVFLPGHLMARLRPAGRPPRNIETLRRGIARSDSFYRATFSLGKRPWYSLEDGSPGQALGALLFNLGNARLASGDAKSALEEYRLVEEALPGFPEAQGNQGVCLMMAGDKGAARERFTAALNGDSLAAQARINLRAMESSSGSP